MRFYDSQKQAMQRVERLKDEAGYWPGVIGPDRDGRYRLSYDPDVAEAQGQTRTGTLPEPTSDRQRSARQAEPEAAPQEASLAQAEADSWLDYDLQDSPEPEELTRSRLTQAELEAEAKAGLPPEAETYDWLKESQRESQEAKVSATRLTQAEIQAEIEAGPHDEAGADWGL